MRDANERESRADERESGFMMQPELKFAIISVGLAGIRVLRKRLLCF